MKAKRSRHDINAWWERVPGERFWLDVTHRDGRELLLAAPRGDDRSPNYWKHRLITHVKAGEVVFHYDASLRAIVAWSISHGRVEKRQLWWPPPAGPSGDAAFCQKLPSWGIGLRQSTTLGTAVPLHEIARIQWSLFPTLRALEDEVGDPLYYPFEMGSREATRPLPGYVFKLPAVFVRNCPELACAAGPERLSTITPIHPVRTPDDGARDRWMESELPKRAQRWT